MEIEASTSVVDVSLGVSIWDGATQPQNKLVEIDVPDPWPTSSLPGAFAPLTPIQLAPNTRYWIVATPDATFTGAWRVADNNAFTGAGTIPDGSVASNDGGSTWISISTVTLKIEVNGTVVPEPSTALLLASGLAALAVGRRLLTA